MTRVCIIGLDCLMPELLFDELQGELPHLSRLAAAGVAGRMQSSLPAITVPAWSCMVTGVDPGVLGVYGFHGRATRDYGARRLMSSLDVREPTLWAHAGRAGLVSRIISVPQTHPPKPVRGYLVSDRPTDGGAAPFTHPPELGAALEGDFGPFAHDVTAHREVPTDELVRRVHELTERRFRLARAFVAERDWQLFMMVEMGADRLQHALLEAHQTGGDGPLGRALRDYYVRLDDEVGRLLALLGDDDVVLVLSDHGAQRMRGGIALNDWLRARGDLVLQGEPAGVKPFDPALVDWPRTRAWADGGYVGRIYVNLRGREPLGLVEPTELEAFLTRLAAELRAIAAPDGQPLATRTHEPRRAYREVRGVAPDLLVELDGMAYRAIGSVGHPSIHVQSNDTGRDEANHSPFGVFVMRDGRGHRPAPADLSLYDVAPTVLDRLGLKVPATMRGRVLA